MSVRSTEVTDTSSHKRVALVGRSATWIRTPGRRPQKGRGIVSWMTGGAAWATSWTARALS